MVLSLLRATRSASDLAVPSVRDEAIVLGENGGDAALGLESGVRNMAPGQSNGTREGGPVAEKAEFDMLLCSLE